LALYVVQCAQTKLWCCFSTEVHGANSAKLFKAYELAIKQAFALYENRFDDDLGNQFVNKKVPEFWKTGLAKVCHNV
jgi:hypothetical protein